MRRHAGIQQVQTLACQFLGHVTRASNCEGVTQAVTAGALEAVTAACKQHVADETTQYWACLTLVNITDGSMKNVARAVKSGAIHAVVAATYRHVGSEGVS
mmetsp:Transcript_11062/g.27035  ORF Transcript_11062/g.27035 Transcript_11062/m.27035 type:complete len:101 (+) Transcript_11062:322-624(+)